MCRIYRQFDGYPDGHGLELAKACNKTLCNGFGLKEKFRTHANGMQCLAAQVIAKLKNNTLGNIYIVPSDGEVEHVDFVYVVKGKEGEKPTILCRNNAGPVFTGTPLEWKKKFGNKKEEAA